MKVGNTRIRLAGAAFAHLRAIKYLTFFITSILLAINSWANSPVPIALPFQLIGKSVFISATVNGKTGHYLFDTGAPDLILNSQYFQDESAAYIAADVMGFNGEAMSTKYQWTQAISIGNRSFKNHYALLLDLSAMERLKHIRIDGIIGYEVIKGMAWQLDFDCHELLLMPAIAQHKNTPPTDSIEIDFSGHIPYIIVKLGGKRLRMGIDTGSERNLLQVNAIKDGSFHQRGKIRLAGLTSDEQHLKVGFVSGFTIGGLQTDSLEVVLADLRQISDELPTRLDGILGISFLKDHQIAINYQRRKAYFWRKPAEINFAVTETCAIGD